MRVGVDPGACEGQVDRGTAAPCRATCPVGTDAAAYVALVAEGRWAAAYDVARQPNPFASICGRVCAAPCERACRRGVLDRPVSIRALKRVLTEAHGVEADASRWSRALGEVPPISLAPIAIVGAGPAGLSAAHDLRLAGHAVALFEKERKPGGMLVHGIPAFRLPRSLIEREISELIALGAVLRTDCEVGRDVSIDSLLEDHAAVLVTVGCGQGRLLETPGADRPGVIRAVDFLRRANVQSAVGAEAVRGPVVVIGGGSVAFDAARSAWRLQGAGDGDGQAMIDAARTAIRSGAGSGGHAAAAVTLVAPEARSELPVPPEELGEAEQEGVVVRGQVGVRRIVGEDAVEGVEVSAVLSLFDEVGRFAPQLDESKTEILPARSVVLAIGQQADTGFLGGIGEVQPAPWGGLAVDAWGRTAHPRLFAAGDVATGPRDLIDAIAAGQRAASAIVHSLAGHPSELDPPARAIEPPEVPAAPPLHEAKRFYSGYDVVPRAELPVRAAGERAFTAEVECGLSADAAIEEASRCLRCDEHLQLAAQRCIACALCADVCPEGCLSLEAAGERVALVLDDTTCIRCGLCVDRCPTDALGFALAPNRRDPAVASSA